MARRSPLLTIAAELLPKPLQAEVRALAKKMLRRKVKEDIIEAAYNRYAL